MSAGDGTDARLQALAATLRSFPVLAHCTREDLAGLLPFLRERRLRPGETLCRAGQPARDMWLVLGGTLRLTRPDRSTHDVCEGIVGEEAALGIDCYLADVAAVDGATVLALPGEAAPARLRGRDSRAAPFGRSLIRIFSPTPFTDAPASTTDQDRLTIGTAAWKLLGWLAAVVLPLLLLRLMRDSGLRWEQRQLAAVLASTASLWMFGVVRPYVAGLLVVLVCATLGIVPTSVVLSGFASNSFFLALSIFCLGAVLIESGAINRGFLLLIKHCPASPFWYDACAFAAGMALTPVVALPQDRARVLAPVAMEAGQTLGYEPGGRDRTRLALAMFTGLTLFSPVFLTGNPLNLILYGSLSEQVQDAVPGLQWTVFAMAAFLVLCGVFWAVYALMFRGAAAPHLSRRIVDAQLEVLGPMGAREWLAVGGVALFLGAVATVSAHKIDHRLIALTIICGYLVLGTLGKNQLNLHVDWSTLILLGTLIGLIATIVHVDLHGLMASRLPWLAELMRYHPRAFVALLAVTVVVAQLVVPQAGALIGVCAVPLAAFNGMSPWVVVFVIVLMSDLWILPNRWDTSTAFQAAAGSRAPIDRTTFLRMNAAMAGARVIALAISVLYWERLRVL